MQTPPATLPAVVSPAIGSVSDGAAGHAKEPCSAFADEFGVSCQRDAGHDGNHRATLGEGATVAWSTPAECICEFAPTCDGSKEIACGGCGGDQCVCLHCSSDGVAECEGCVVCLPEGDDDGESAEDEYRREAPHSARGD